METFMMPIGGKMVLRRTGEEVEIIDSNMPNRGMRTEPKDLTFEEGDWVTYIDSNGNEHIKEHLNIQFDFKPIVNNTFNKVFDFATNKMPTTRNSRIFEVAKALVIKQFIETGVADAISKNGCMITNAVIVATNLVDKVGIETE